MKTKHRIFSVLTVLALVASLMAVTAAPAGATAAAITLIPTSGVPGTAVTVKGTGFPVHLPGTLTAIPAGVIAPASFTVGANGTFALIATILPGAPVGPATFIATVGGVIAHAPFRVVTLTLTPTSGPVGTGVTVIGAGFMANITGILTAAPAVITPVTFTTGAGGEIGLIATILPGAPVGPATFNATVGAHTGTATFTVTVDPPLPPAITLSPPSGLPGTSVNVTGVRFPAHAPGVLTAPGRITAVAFNTTAAGAIPATPVIILPGATTGPITATVGVHSASAIFTVIPPPPILPSINATLTAGARGTNVTVTGADFPHAAAPVGAMGVIMAPGVIAPAVFTIKVAGVIPPTPVTILPDAPIGPATITATVGAVSVTTTFTVQAPAITLLPIGGVPGALVTVRGVGFPIATAGNITAPGVIIPAPFTTTTPDGRIPGTPIPPAVVPPVGETPVTVHILPGTPSGPVTFTATVDPPGPLPAVTATATYTVGIPASITLTPAIGFGGTGVTVGGFGFPFKAPGTITAPGVISPVTFMTDTHGRILPAANITILPGAPVGPATITVTVAGVTATANFTVAGVLPPPPPVIVVPPVPVLEGLEHVWGKLGKSVWHFRAGEWFQYHTVPEIHELIPVGQRLVALEVGQAYWIYLTKPITDVLIGGKLRTLPAGWHNIGWIR